MVLTEGGVGGAKSGVKVVLRVVLRYKWYSPKVV